MESVERENSLLGIAGTRLNCCEQLACENKTFWLRNLIENFDTYHVSNAIQQIIVEIECQILSHVAYSLEISLVLFYAILLVSTAVSTCSC